MSWPGYSLGHGPRHEKTQDGFLVLSHLDGLYVQDWLDKYRPDRNQCHGCFVEEELSQRRRPIASYGLLLMEGTNIVRKTQQEMAEQQDWGWDKAEIQ